MCEINDVINSQEFDKLQIRKLKKTDTVEVLSISMEKETVFPKHTSPTEAQLIMLEGDINFHINKKSFHLIDKQHFSFPAKTEHWVKANKNSKFLIIR